MIRAGSIYPLRTHITYYVLHNMYYCMSIYTANLFLTSEW